MVGPDSKKALLPVCKSMLPSPLIFNMQAPFFIERDSVENLNPIDIVMISQSVILCNTENAEEQNRNEKYFFHAKKNGMPPGGLIFYAVQKIYGVISERLSIQ